MESLSPALSGLRDSAEDALNSMLTCWYLLGECLKFQVSRPLIGSTMPNICFIVREKPASRVQGFRDLYGDARIHDSKQSSWIRCEGFTPACSKRSVRHWRRLASDGIDWVVSWMVTGLTKPPLFVSRYVPTLEPNLPTSK